MKELTIYRDSWVNASNRTNETFSSLLNHYNRQCCLGQILAQTGTKLEKLYFMSFPCGVHKTNMREDMFDLFVNQTGTSTPFCLHQADTNDDSDIPQSERERMLAENFEKKGYRLNFVDGKAPWLEGWRPETRTYQKRRD